MFFWNGEGVRVGEGCSVIGLMGKTEMNGSEIAEIQTHTHTCLLLMEVVQLHHCCCWYY